MTELYAAVDGGFITPKQSWRPLRPVLLLMVAVLVAVVARLAPWGVWIEIVGLGSSIVLLAACIAMRGLARRDPRRVVIIELELGARVLFVATALSSIVYAFAWLSEKYQDKGSAYFIGIVAGAAVGFFSKELFKSSDAESWMAIHWRYVMNRLYSDYFYKQDPSGIRYDASPPSRWAPDSIMSDALCYNQYKNENNVHVDGWSFRARRLRGATLHRGLIDPPEAIPALPHERSNVALSGPEQPR